MTMIIDYRYPEWPNRQCVGMVFRRSNVRGSLSAVSLVICSPARIAVCNTWSSGGTTLCRVGGAISQLDLPSLTPLSVAVVVDCNQGHISWATSVNYCKQLIIEPTFCGSRFSTGGSWPQKTVPFFICRMLRTRYLSQEDTDIKNYDHR